MEFDRTTLIILALTGVFVFGGVAVIVFGPGGDDAPETVEVSKAKTDVAKAGAERAEPPAAREIPAAPHKVDDAQYVDGEEGLKYYDIAVGTGAEAKAGYPAIVEYTGFLTTGEMFDSSFKRPDPFNFNLETGRVIKGWHLGVKGMKVGGKRQLKIPPELAYGDKDRPNIPANSTLIFDIELVDVRAAPDMPALTGAGWKAMGGEGLKVNDLVVGDGAPVERGSVVEMEFTGWLAKTGEDFHSTYRKMTPMKAVADMGGLFPGWDQALVGMKPGGKRAVQVPSKLAYGPEGRGKRVPPDSDLVLMIDLTGVEATKRIAPDQPAKAAKYTAHEVEGDPKYKFADIVQGDGPTGEKGALGNLEFTMWDAKGEIVNTTYRTVETPMIPLGGPRGLPAFGAAEGMRVNGTRDVRITAKEAFGKLRLPPGIDEGDELTILFELEGVRPAMPAMPTQMPGGAKMGQPPHGLNIKKVKGPPGGAAPPEHP